MNQRIKASIVILLTAALLIGSAACSTDSTADAVKISTQAVKQGDLLIGLYADGRVSISSTLVYFSINGSIAEMPVSLGQMVSSGDLLARLDDTDLQSSLKSAELNVARAEEALSEAIQSRSYTLASEQIRLVSLEREIYDSQYNAIENYNQQILKIDNLMNSDLTVANAEIALEIARENDDEEDSETSRLNLEKAELALEEAIKNRNYTIELERQKLIPIERAYLEAQAEIAKDHTIYTKQSQDYDMQKLKVDYLKRSDAAVSSARFNLEEAKSRLAEASLALDATILKAPVAGIVTSISSEVGDRVTADTANSTTGLLTIAQNSSVYITANITESDIADLSVGQAMRITVDALTLENQPGKITEISAVPKIDNTGIVTYAVTGQFDQPDERILNGMTTFVTYIKKEKQDVLLVSNKAISIEEGQQYAMVQAEDGTLEKRAVTCGLTNGTVSEVIEGLAAGEKVVTSGLNP